MTKKIKYLGINLMRNMLDIYIKETLKYYQRTSEKT